MINCIKCNKKLLPKHKGAKLCEKCMPKSEQLSLAPKPIKFSKRKIFIDNRSLEQQIEEGADPPEISFYMVVVENGVYPPKIKHETYEEALQECIRISKKENKKAFVLKSISQVEQISKTSNHSCSGHS